MTAARSAVLLFAVACGEPGSGGGPSTGRAADGAPTRTDAGGEADAGREADAGGDTDAGGEADAGEAPADGGGEPAVVVFDNPDGAFVWTPNYVYEGDVIMTGAFLDLTRSAGSQTGEVSPSGVVFYMKERSGLGTWGGIWFRSWRAYEPNDTAVRLAAGEDFILSDGSDVDLFIVPPLAKSAGDTVGPDDRWMQQLDAAHMQDPGGSTPWDAIWFTGGTIGVRFDLDDGAHYGFVELTMEPVDRLEQVRFEPVRWGYATATDTALVIPP